LLLQAETSDFYFILVYILAWQCIYPDSSTDATVCTTIYFCFIFTFVLVSIFLCLFSVLGSVPAEGVRPTPCVALTMKQTLF
jgi:hypothetical protein